ncbi:MAG: hypothetical protein ACK6D5_17495 [Planctomyces sp.]
MHAELAAVPDSLYNVARANRVIASVLPLNHRADYLVSPLMFINPMWDHESQRIGKQRCTPTGYMLHGISDLIGFIAIICLFGIPIYLVYAGIRGHVTWGMLWLRAAPFVIAIVGNIMHSYSWHLAEKQQFKYDYEKCVSTWVDELGNQQTYKYGVDGGESDQSAVQ